MKTPSKLKKKIPKPTINPQLTYGETGLAHRKQDKMFGQYHCIGDCHHCIGEPTAIQEK